MHCILSSMCVSNLECFYWCWSDSCEMDESETEEVLLIDLRSPDTNMQILMEKLTGHTQNYDSDR